MEFYRLEYLLQNYEEFVEEENKQYKQQQKDQEGSMAKTSSSFKNLGQMKPPKFNAPKISMPKF
jgi:hypothetical protein